MNKLLILILLAGCNTYESEYTSTCKDLEPIYLCKNGCKAYVKECRIAGKSCLIVGSGTTRAMSCMEGLRGSNDARTK